MQLKPPEIDFFIAGPEDMELDPEVKFDMEEERTGCYEAARHTLLGRTPARWCNGELSWSVDI